MCACVCICVCACTVCVLCVYVWCVVVCFCVLGGHCMCAWCVYAVLVSMHEWCVWIYHDMWVSCNSVCVSCQDTLFSVNRQASPHSPSCQTGCCQDSPYSLRVGGTHLILWELPGLTSFSASCRTHLILCDLPGLTSFSESCQDSPHSLLVAWSISFSVSCQDWPHSLKVARTHLILCELLDWLLPGGAEPGPTLCWLLTDRGPGATLGVVPGEPKAARAGGRGCISSSYTLTSSCGRVDR